jgi:hypothetical protein
LRRPGDSLGGQGQSHRKKKLIGSNHYVFNEYCTTFKKKQIQDLMHKLQVTFFAILFMIIFSCKDDDQVQNTASKIEVITGGSPNSFVMLSDQDGEVLFSKVDLNGNESITVDVDPTQEIDFTYGVLTGGQIQKFYIETYRNVALDFNYDATFLCREYVGINTDRRILTIENYDGEIIYSPFQDTLRSGKDMIFSGNTVNKDIVVTIFDEEANQVKSKFIRLEDWEAQADDTFTLTLNFDDFKEATEKRISTNFFSKWYSIAKVEQTDGSLVELSTLYRYSQEGNQVTLYIPEGLEYQYVDLQIQSTSDTEGYFYVKKKLDTFPEKINFTDNDFTNIQSGSTGYELQSRGEYDHAKIRYGYNVDTNFSEWFVYQKNESDLIYSMPILPEEVLNRLSPISEYIDEPNSIGARFIQMEEFDGLSKYSKNINDLEKCVGYTESYSTTYY